MLRFNPFSLATQQSGLFNFAAPQNGGFQPVDLDSFLQTGDIFQASGFGSQQDFMQMMQAQLLAGLLMQLDPSMLVQLAMMSMLGSQMGGGAGSHRGNMGGGGFSSGRSRNGWSGARAGNDHGHTHGADGPRSRGQTGIPDGLRANAARGAQVVREMGFDGTIGGLGHRSGASDHPHGNAIDVMTHGDTRMGRAVAERFRQNHDELGVKYVIYQQQIASPRTGWQWQPMRDRGSPTANHMDHPHISFH